VLNGLKLNSVLLIPNKSSSKISIIQPNKCAAFDASGDAKETMYGIEKKYGVSGEDLRRANPFIEEEALQIDKPSLFR
jgi:hypothetical protein